jgi:hypothetical protein
MEARDIWNLILTVLVYSGPLLPMVATLLIRNASRERRNQNLRWLLLLTSIQALTFAPFFYGVVIREPDALHALYLPFFVGIPMFLGTLVYAASEYGRARRSPATAK